MSAPTTCPCCQGRVDFSWFNEACDACAAALVTNDYDETVHGHRFSDEQTERIFEDWGQR